MTSRSCSGSCSHSPETISSDAADTTTDSPDIDLFPAVSEFRQRFTSNFIFSHLNINSYRNKFDFMHDVLSKKLVDYLAISESKLDSSFPSAQFHVEGYVILRQDNTDSSGGLIIYVRSDLPHRRLPDAECNSNGIESLCVEVTVGKSKTVLTCIYKHPKVKKLIFKECISKMADKLMSTHDDLIFLGDWNCCPHKSNTVKDFCDMYNLRNLITEPTCHKGNVSSLLDVIVVSNPRRYAGVLNSDCQISDFHNIIGAATKRFAPSQRPRKISYRSYKHFDEDDYLYDMGSAPFHVADIFSDVDDKAWFTSALINDIIDSHAPIKSKMVKSHSVPYMNSLLRKTQCNRNMARN